MVEGYTRYAGGYYKDEDGSGPFFYDGTTMTPVSGSGGGSGGGGEVTVSNFPATQAVSGPVTNSQLVAVTGTAAQTTVASDPAAAGLTVASLLRGILSEMKAQTAILNDIKTNTTPAEAP